jgi:chorismate dehydratase
MLRIGCVKYLNARPLIHAWPGAVDFDHPAALCRKLERGDLDVALVSSLEYLRRPIYRIVDGVSISAHGSVYSVVVAHNEDLSRAQEIEIDPASETSVALLRCLLNQRGLNPLLRVRNTDLQSVRPAELHSAESATTTRASAESGTADSMSAGRTGQRPVFRLLIGDQAIRFRAEHRERYHYWDLAETWTQATSLPFVFALWLIRPEIENAKEIADALRRIRDHNLENLDDIVSTQSDVSPEFCRKYYQKHLFFDLGEFEKAGLREFYRRCLLNKIDVAPELQLNLV